MGKSDYTFTATIHSNDFAKGGIGIYGDEKNILGLSIDSMSVRLWKSEKGNIQNLAETKLPGDSALQLRMTVRDGGKFRFHASHDGKQWQPVGDQEIDGSFLPPWDRAPRVGLMVSGKSGDVGIFDKVELRYAKP